MRQSLNSSAVTTLTVVTTLLLVAVSAAFAIAEEKQAKPGKKAIGNVEYGDVTVGTQQAGKGKSATRHQANIKFGDLTASSATTKKKKPKQLSDIVVVKKPDKSTPRLSGPASPTGGDKALTRGGLLEGQGALGTAGPSATGSPAMPASPRGAVIH